MKLPETWPFPTDQRTDNAPLERCVIPDKRRNSAISKCRSSAQRIVRPPITDIENAPY